MQKPVERTAESIEAPRERHAALREFVSLKKIERFDELIRRSLRLSDGQGYLVPVSELFAEDPQAIATLSRFRAGVTTFPGTFQVTDAGTKRWLRMGLLDVPDRILFFVFDRCGHVVGHLGFAHVDNAECRMELDNVIRGVAGVEPGIMANAVRRLAEWAHDNFSPSEIHLRVLDDNQRAIQFYERLGFVANGREPLRRVESNGDIRFVPVEPGDDAPADRHYLCMRLQSPLAASEPYRRSA